jgi:hypothetical protein
MLFQEAGSIVCAQAKMKQLQADIDCILKACYAKNEEGSAAGCAKDSRKPDCNALEVLYDLLLC